MHITTLDEVIPELNLLHVDLLKIDMEGFEADVLRGSADTIRLVDRIIVECHSRALELEVDALLRQYAFSHIERIDVEPHEEVKLVYARRSAA